jgi:hypothetical protein
VKFATKMRWATALVLTSSLLTFAGVPASDKKDKEKAAATQSVDSGSFGVFIKGQRVVTEIFTVQQENGSSVVKAQLKEPSGSTIQKSDLQMTPNFELIRYEWSQASGGSLTVLPNNDFLIEKISAATSTKPAEQPFLMPSTTPILDNNFFVHREILLWRYLAADCKPDSGNLKCQQGPVEFGTLVPQDRTSLPVRVEVVGKEKITIRGAARDLLRINLTGEAFAWSLWVDDQDHFKLIRVAIPADDTEVVRD